MNLELTPLTFEKDKLRPFLALPDTLYVGDPHWIAPFQDSQAAFFKAEHPFYHYGKAQSWLATRSGQPVGRITAALNERLVEDGKPVGLLGFYEAADDPEVGKALLETATAWLKNNGAEVARGPINFSTWYSYRLVTEFFHAPPFLSETRTLPYYPAQWEKAGFQATTFYFSAEVSDHQKMLDGLEAKYAAFTQAGYGIRSLDLDNWDQELETLFHLTAEIFAGNWSYSFIDSDEFLDLYAGSKSLVDPDLFLWAVDPHGKTVGFVFGYPDRAEAVRRMRGQRHWLAKLRYLTAPAPDRAVLKTLGVLPEARSAQVGSALVYQFHLNAQIKGYSRVIHALMHQDNHSLKISAHGGTPMRRYAVYERRL